MCDDYLRKAKDLVRNASITLAPAPVLVLVAIALNGGFFTAPGAPVPMFAAAAFAFAAVALLKMARDALTAWELCGGVAAKCKGKLTDIMNYLAAAIATVGIVAGASFAIALWAYVPWVPLVPMGVVYVAIVAAVGMLLALQLNWAPLDECQAAVAKSRGPLLAGEKASDPWFLRLNPVEGSYYAMPAESEVINPRVPTDKWRICAEISVKEWLIEAVATITGNASAVVTFSWTLEGAPLPPSSIASDNLESVLKHKLPPVSGAMQLKVMARDADGFTRSRDVSIELSESQLECRAILPLVPLHPKSPKLPWTAERLRPAVEAFTNTINEIEERERQVQIDGQGR